MEQGRSGSQETGRDLLHHSPDPGTMKRYTTRNAFTLIELLIVVAIISVLATIALINVQQARRRAEVAQSKSNLKALGTALGSYRLDYGEFPLADGIAGREASPNKTEAGNGPAAGGSWDGVPWELLDKHYIESPNAFYCPALQRMYPDKPENFRYAYNHSARDTGGAYGGASNVDNPDGDHWVCRCFWVPAQASFHRNSGYVYPHGDDADDARYRSDVMENVLYSNMRVELRNGRRDWEDRDRAR